VVNNNNPSGNLISTTTLAPVQPGSSGSQAVAANSTTDGVLIGSPESSSNASQAGNSTSAGNSTLSGNQTLLASQLAGMANKLGNMTSSMEASFYKYLLQTRSNSSSSNNSSLTADSTALAAPAGTAAVPATPAPPTNTPVLQF